MTAKSKLKMIFTAAVYVLVAILTIFVAVVLFLNLSGKTVFIFGRSAMWVKTQSMEPTIPEKSYILVREATAEDVEEGDVIVFKSDDPELRGAMNKILSLPEEELKRGIVAASSGVSRHDRCSGVCSNSALAMSAAP